MRRAVFPVAFEKGEPTPMILPITTTAHTFRAEKITFCRGRQAVLKDVSLALSPGECVAVVGPNGAGKSSLLKIFSGDLAP